MIANSMLNQIINEERIYDDIVSPMSNVVDRAICALRRKLKAASDAAPLIQTRRGQGYIVEAAPS